MDVSDVLIVGAGLAGATAAYALAKQGVSVTLIDQRSRCHPCFKAEKVEPDQVELLRRLGLFDALRPKLTAIREISVAHAGQVYEVQRIEQYAVAYEDLVNAVRDLLEQMPVRFVQGKVTSITNSIDLQSVVLHDGASFHARLLVMASGSAGALGKSLGMRTALVNEVHSLIFGFDVTRTAKDEFSFDSLTYFPEQRGKQLGFITFFKIGARMRVNLFTYWALSDERVRKLIEHAVETLQTQFPQLGNITGAMQVDGKVAACPIRLYRMEDVCKAGVVLIGDAYQSVCPATGTGLSRVLTDVLVLRDCAERWLKTPTMTPSKINEYYRVPQKITVDQRALTMACTQRQLGCEESLYWCFQRKRQQLRSALRGFGAKCGIF